ncbi:MAG: hypothetical protein KIG68_09515 [Oxalobacter sp.]|nr:hypothetical protein [Oxalobacter sp.]
MSFSRKEVLEFYEMWKEAYEACSTGQSYQIGTRRLSRVDIDKVYREMMRWKAMLDDIDSGRRGGIRVRRVVPMDY